MHMMLFDVFMNLFYNTVHNVSIAPPDSLPLHTQLMIVKVGMFVSHGNLNRKCPG